MNIWDHSSAGEHYAEDVGVLGSTPSGPMFDILKRFIKDKTIIILCSRKKRKR